MTMDNFNAPKADVELYQQVVLEHNKRPKNFGKLSDYTNTAEGFNPICGDHYHITFKVDENGCVEKVGFEGDGCAISKASASMLTERLKGLNRDEYEEVFNAFRSMLAGNLTIEESEKLGKLRVFSGIYKFPARVKCAGLAWHATRAAFNGQNTASTES